MNVELYPGETLNLREKNDTSNSLPDNESFADEEINLKYIKGDVRIITEQARYPLSSIPDMISGGKYNLNPEFQRRHRWSEEKQSRLIESFIINVPIPPIFLYEYQFAHYEVMDGLQRLTAINNFYTNKLTLQGLEEWPELNGRNYSELPDRVRQGVDRRYLSSIILLQETAKSIEEATILKQKVFQRINTGGVQLSYQESRNAILDGRLNQLCVELARNKFLIKTWNFPTDEELKNEIPDTKKSGFERYRKMDDVELVLRFFAYRQHQSAIPATLKDYLDRYLQLGNREFSQDTLNNLKRAFNTTIQLVFNIFGEQAFWRLRSRKTKNSEQESWKWLQRPTTVIYDPLMFVFSRYTDQANCLIKHKDVLKQKIEQLYKQNYDAFGGRDVSNKQQSERIELFDNMVREVLAHER